jgi:hypothetical protein
MTDDMPRLPEALRRDLVPPPGGMRRLHDALHRGDVGNASTRPAFRRRLGHGLALAGVLGALALAALPALHALRSTQRLETRLSAAIADSGRPAPDVALAGFAAVRMPTPRDDVQVYRLQTLPQAIVGGRAP